MLTIVMPQGVSPENVVLAAAWRATAEESRGPTDSQTGCFNTAPGNLVADAAQPAFEHATSKVGEILKCVAEKSVEVVI